MFQKALTAFFVMAIVIGGFPVAPAQAATTYTALADLEAGDLFRGPTFSAVYYYGADGFRYVFPNDKTYFTWYSDFSNIKWVTDTDLGRIQIGGNVTYKPGVRMIKINTDPKTYTISADGGLRWVETEAVAIELFGSSWNTMIDDVPDGFFGNYTRDNDIGDTDEADAYQATIDAIDETYDINEDKGLVAPLDIEITDDGYSDSSFTIEAGQTVRWTNNGDEKHTATSDDLDWGSGTLDPNGDFWIRRFTEPGTYTFFCSYHPDMTGTLIVE